MIPKKIKAKSNFTSYSTGKPTLSIEKGGIAYIVDKKPHYYLIRFPGQTQGTNNTERWVPKFTVDLFFWRI